MVETNAQAAPLGTFIARNYSTFPDGSIHDDEEARAYGYQGGVVPGVALYTASLPLVVARRGTEWAGHERVRLRFTAPSYEGDGIEVVTGADDGPVTGHVECRRSDGRSSCTIRIGPNDAPPPDTADFPHADPTPRGDRTPEDHLLRLEHMASIDVRPTAEDIDQYLRGVGAARDDFGPLGLVNPGFLLRTYTLISRANFATKLAGPTLHVESDARYYRPVTIGEPLSLRGRVRHVFAKRGNRYATFDYAWFTAEDQAVLHDVHTVVYQLRSHRPQTAATAD